MKTLDISYDERTTCWSVLTKMTINDYLKLVESAYGDRGKIEGQRAPLKTKTAQRDRQRMVDDLKKGAIIPPIVLGVLLTEHGYKSIIEDPNKFCDDIFKKIEPKNHISIIDGMQRTTAIYEAFEKTEEHLDKEIRVEFWFAPASNSMLYRMLVLNSGQIPWTLRRQVEVLYRQFKDELENKIPRLRLITSDDQARRKGPGEYQTDQFIELFLLFGLRKTKISLQEQIAEEFARLDFIESTSVSNFNQHFESISKLLVDFDYCLSNLVETSDDFPSSRFKSGMDIFTSQPARVGFIVAASRYIYDLPGVQREEGIINQKIQSIVANMNKHIAFLQKRSALEFQTLLDLPSLDERIKLPAGKVGEFEREYFLKAFHTLFQLIEHNTSLSSYTPLWVA